MSATTRVLVVDDNYTVVRLLTTMLQRMDCQVLTASDGPLAIRTAKEEKPDLILIDMRLPGIDGIEVVRTIRSLPALSTTPIIGLTGYAMVIREEQVLDAGCNAFFTKPFDIARLQEKIGELLAASGVSGISPPESAG